MKTPSLLAAASLLTTYTVAFPASHFTITALGDLVPSGYDGYTYSVRFLIRDKLNAATLTKCHSSWKKKSNFPSNYITCDDPNWQWQYLGQYKECDFSLSLAHSDIKDDGDGARTNVTSYATVIPSQVPCGVGASQNFTCIYGSSGAQLCGLGEGRILQVPVRSTKTQKIKATPQEVGKGKRSVMLLVDQVVEEVKEWDDGRVERLSVALPSPL